MKRTQTLIKSLLTLSLFAIINLPIAAYSANLLLANKPLVDSSTSDVSPNLMYILDNSGSMGQDYTPDWAGENLGNPILDRNPAYNTQSYNPTIRYTPAVTYTGTSMGDQVSPWTAVKNDVTDLGATKNGTTNLVGNASYTAFLPGEYCKAADLTDCIQSATPNAANQFPAPMRWCRTAAAAVATAPAAGDCRLIREETFVHLRAPVFSTTVTITGSTATRFTGVTVNGQQLMSGQTNSTSNTTTMASEITNRINACTNGLTGNCQITGFSAVSSNNTVRIIAPWNALPTAGTNTPAFTKTGGNLVAGTQVFAVRGPTWGNRVQVNIVSTTTSYTEPGKTTADPDRTDCTGTCTYAQEMTNYANWHTYYRTRMQMMKTSTSLAFKDIKENYRIGFITISNFNSTTNYLKIDKFELGVAKQKANWYNKLFATNPSSGTPLRSSLSTVGRLYAGLTPFTGSGDPVQYACQKNFSLLTTDGYWNTDNASDVRDLAGNAIGNLDNDVNTRSAGVYEGASASSGSLADVAKYYNDFDLRRSDLNNCNGALGQNVCGEAAGDESIKQQNMTTFTLGLGIDGTLLYSSDYKTQATGDFSGIKSGSKNWPNPMTNTQGGRIDDLWHAAVNGNGTYFSARNPKELTASLRKALSDIQSKVGTGSAAAASSLQPTKEDNYNYVASYMTSKWIGNIEARPVNLTTLVTSPDADWCVEDVAADSCIKPAQLELYTVDNKFYCKTTSSNTDKCDDLGGTLTGTDCRVAVATSCTGKLQAQVAANSRSIFFNGGTSAVPVRRDFTYTNLNNSGFGSFFQATALTTNLNQWPDLTATAGTGQRDRAVGDGIVNFLRGQKTLEDRPSNPPEDRIFRQREATLGDVTESQPAYIAQPKFKYTDAGYEAFKTAQLNRIGTIYVGANDGMLHAFYANKDKADSNNGKELWAFVPTPVIPKMAKLADRDYATNHVNLVNGDPVIAEVCISGKIVCASSATSADWRTVLVGGLSGGGRGYYALDITEPTAPKLLWEFKADSTNPNLGYTYGTPIVTKMADGTWVALLSSGYNNGALDTNQAINNPAGDGRGYLYIVDIKTGLEVKPAMRTNAGTAATPSGLAPLAAFVQQGIKNNLATFLYGGDLDGNLWRFDINAVDDPLTASIDESRDAVRIATLTGPSSSNPTVNLPQPITTIPQLGVINKKRVIFVGTGKYLEVADLSNKDKQSIYAIKDDELTGSVGSPRLDTASFVNMNMSLDRKVATQIVDFNTKLGWFADLPDSGERVNIDPLLVNGVLLAPSIVPSSTSCSPGGYGWFNFLTSRGVSPIISSSLVSEKMRSPIVGFNVIYDAAGNPNISATGADDATGFLIDNKDAAAGSGSNRTKLFIQNPDGTYGKKSIWRELTR
jgi:type IV pilus assembly protein PilY1